MIRWIRWTAAALALAVIAAGFPAAAQTPRVLLRLKIDPGKTLNFNVSGSVTFSLELNKSQTTTTAEHSAREAVRGVRRNPDGSFVVEDALLDFRVKTEGQTQSLPDTRMTLTVRPDGTVVNVTPPHPMDSYPFTLPDHPVAVGDSWTGPVDEEDSGITIRGTETYTLAAVEPSAGGQVAHIQTRIEGSVAGADLPDLPPDMKGRFSGSASGTGTIDWLVNQGRLLQTADTLSIEGTLELTGQNETVKAPMTVTVTSKEEAAPVTPSTSTR